MNDRRLMLTLELARQLINTSRHLSQHPGGFVLTRDRLDELVPIEPAAMEDRQVIEWDKDDIDRSEEHTSELQSLMRISYAVFCLKKTNKRQKTKHHNNTRRTEEPLYI